MLIVCQWFAELLPLLDVISCEVQTLGGAADGATGNIESATIESRERDLESCSLLAEKILFWNLDIVKIDNSCGLHVPTHFVLVGSEGETFCAILEQQT